MDPTPVVHGTLLGLVLSAVAHRPWRRGPVSDFGALLMSLGFGAAYLAGWQALNGRPPLAPTQPAHWLLWLIPAATLVSLVQRRQLGAPLLWILRAALVGGFLFATFAPVARNEEWQGGTRLLAASLLFATGLWTLVWAEAVARRAGDPAQVPADGRGAGFGPSFVLMVWGGFAAGLLGTTSSVSALTVGAMNSFFGIACAWALLRPEKAFWRGATAPFAFGVWALLFTTTYYAALEPLPAGLLLLALPLGTVPVGPLRGLRAGLLRGLLVGAVGGVALWLAWPEPSLYY